MKRVINSIIEVIHDRITPEGLGDIIARFIADVLNGDMPDDAQACMAMTAGDIRKVGAVWRNNEIWENIISDISAKFLHMQFGELMMAASESAEDLLDMVMSTKQTTTDAGIIAAARLERQYANLPYSEVDAQSVSERATEAITITALVKAVQQAIVEMEAPAQSASVYQFPTSNTLR